MCNPMLFVAGVSAMQYLGGKAQAHAMYDAQGKATQLSYSQLHNSQIQTNQSAALEESNQIQKGMIDRAKIATVAGESGALGISSDRLLGDSFFQEGSDISILEKNRQNAIQSLSNQQKAQQVTGQISNQVTASKEPTLIGTGLQIGADISSGGKSAKTKATVSPSAKAKTDMLA